MEISDFSKEMIEAERSINRRLNKLLEPQQFADLVTLASDTCLSAPLPELETIELADEANIMRVLGTRGLKAAIELTDPMMAAIDRGRSVHNMNIDTNDYKGTYPDRFIVEFDSPIRHPASFSDNVSFDVVRKAEQFGSQLMHESVTVLGEDVREKIDALQSALTLEDKLEVVDWLDDRLTQISLDHDPGQRDVAPQDRFYHPARISPKIIGTYPDINISPTCQSASVIAAGFFRAAGFRTMHASVHATNNEDDTTYGLDLVDAIRQSLEEKTGIALPDVIKSSLDTLYERATTDLYRPEATHAAVYVELTKDQWLQFDPYYGASAMVYFEDSNAKLNEVADTLESSKDIAPNLEIAVRSFDAIQEGRMSKRIFEAIKFEHTPLLLESAKEELLNNDPESLARRVYQKCIEQFFAEESYETEGVKAYVDLLRHTHTFNKETGDKEPVVDHHFNKLFSKYVLWGEDTETVLNRCSTDTQYLQDRAENITLLPYLIMAAMSMQVIASPPHPRLHSILEFGRTESRIGLSVLSDFAVHTHSPLPASFWISNWPSQVPPLEYIDRADDSYEDQLHIRSNLVFRHDHPLTALKNYNIVETFLNKEPNTAPETPE